LALSETFTAKTLAARRLSVRAKAAALSRKKAGWLAANCAVMGPRLEATLTPK
jgi:hypothetical protein